MRIYRHLRLGLPLPLPAHTPQSAEHMHGRAIAIGSFDGLHLGHQALLQTILSLAKDRGLSSCVLSFHPHPRQFFQPEHAPARLLPLRDKFRQLAGLGINETVLLQFNHALAKTSAEAFILNILVKTLSCRHVVVGEDFRFGEARKGNIALLKSMGENLGFEVSAISDVRVDSQRVSSSRLREALTQGDLQTSHGLLGKPYVLTGRVRHGQKIGRTLGFPTLNLSMPHNLAARGIFAVEVKGLDDSKKSFPGVASLGRRPTVEDNGRMLLEVYVFDWQGQVYGRHLEVTLRQFIRPEVRFDSLEEMQNQMRDDLRKAKAFFHLV